MKELDVAIARNRSRHPQGPRGNAGMSLEARGNARPRSTLSRIDSLVAEPSFAVGKAGFDEMAG